MTRTSGKAAALAIVSMHSASGALAMSEAMGECLLARIETADADLTVGELSSACAEEINAADGSAEETSGDQRQSAVDIRIEADADARAHRFAISTHRPNYFLYTYNDDPNVVPYGAPEGSLDKEEIKFQVSFKTAGDRTFRWQHGLAVRLYERGVVAVIQRPCRQSLSGN